MPRDSQKRLKRLSFIFKVFIVFSCLVSIVQTSSTRGDISRDGDPLPPPLPDAPYDDSWPETRSQYFPSPASILPAENGNLDPRLPKTDCTEKPTSPAAFVSSAMSSSTQDLTQFLKSIPASSMQNYDLVYDSGRWPADRKDLKEQGHEFPRVIRWSTDGKTVMSYDCNPNAPDFGQLDIQTFDDATRRFSYTKRDFPVVAGKHIPPNHSQEACSNCHGGPDGRPNWGGYQNWPGVYGGDLDLLSAAKDSLSYLERQAFLKFKTDQADNPCYSTLPGWTSPLHKEYPYRAADPRESKTYGVNHPEFSPSDRLLASQVRLNALRTARKIESFKDYPKIKYILMMEGLGCTIRPEDQDLVNSVLAGSEYSQSGALPVDTYDQRDIRTSPILYFFGKVNGLQNTDWSLNFKATEPRYNTGSDPVAAFTSSQLLYDEIQKLPASVTQGLELPTDDFDSQNWGPRYDCIQSEASAIDFNNWLDSRLLTSRACKLLHSQQAASPKKRPEHPCETLPTQGPLTGAVASLKRTVPHIAGQLYPFGKSEYSKVCSNCHTAESFQGLTPKEIADRMTNDTVSKPRMPKGFPTLSTTQAEDVAGYIATLKLEK